MSRVWHRTSCTSSTVQWYQESLRFALVYNNLGNAYRAQGDVDKAIEAYDEGITLEPDYPGLYNNRAIALCDRGDHERAEADFRTAIEKDPGYAVAHSNLGNLYFLQGLYARARVCYETAVGFGHAPAQEGLENTLQAMGLGFPADYLSQDDADFAVRLYTSL